MKRSSLLLLALTSYVFAAPALSAAQTKDDTTTFTRPRTVSDSQRPAPSPAVVREAASPSQNPPAQTAPEAQTRQPAQLPAQVTSPAQTPAQPPAGAAVAPPVPLQPARPLPVSRFRTRVDEAQRLLKSRLQLTAATTPSTFFVTIAAYDQDDSRIHLVSIPKQTLLTRGAEVSLSTNHGLPVRLQVVRPNYVNTALVIADTRGRQLTPLLIEYPIEKGGRFTEMAYYTSAHPALVSPEVVRNGKSYVRTMLDLAAGRLKEKGKIISPQVVDIAERLSVVEHVDHQRFRTEDRKRLYEEVYALFALNELDTYRYSVSSAGAGGMVQMIPSTYAMVRRLHPSVGLNPDFVAGMRNHGNALEAMLLYMQDTWNGLALNEAVLDALANKWATQSDLIAAGYNSNPARLPGYIRRGGAGWRTLIPRETQIYLQIYSSLESLIEFDDRAKGGGKKEEAKNGTGEQEQR